MNTRSLVCSHMICGASLMVFASAMMTDHRQMECLSADAVVFAERSCATFGISARERKEIVYSMALCRGVN